MFSKIGSFIKTYKFESFLAFFCLLVFALETINQRLWMNDFRVYWSASQALLDDGQIYGKAFGLDSGFYKYSPIAALLFSPLGMLPFAIAKTIYYIANSVAMVWLFVKLRQLDFFKNADFSKQTTNLILVVLFVLNAPQLFRELHLGNTNIILLLVNTSALLLISRQPSMAGLLIGLGILFKPHFVLILPLLLLRRRFQSLNATLLTLIAGLILPFMLVGWQGYIDLMANWWQSIAQHNTSLTSAKDNLAFILFSLLGQQSTKIYFWFELVVILALAIFVLAIVVKHLKAEKRHSRNTFRKHFQSEYLLLLAIIPSLFITDTEHFLLAIPLICLLIFKAWPILIGATTPISKMDKYFLILLGLALGLLLISDFVASNPMLGIGNALLIALFGWSELQKQKPKKQPK